MTQYSTVVKAIDLRREEATAKAAIKPGHLIEKASDGEVQVHSTADGFARPLVAIENFMAGEGIDDTYAADDTVHFVTAAPGDWYYMWIADAQTIAIGDKLASAGNGELQEAGAGTKQVIAIAEEAVTTSGAASRIKVSML